jgi:ATP/maltotriose-dependent transcriptional regulator MalT
MQNKHDEARKEYEEGRRLSGGVAGPSFGLAHLEAASGNVAEARRLLTELTEARSRRVVSAWGIAALHARFHARWSRQAADEMRAAHLGPIRMGGGRGPVDPVAEARAVARAERSAEIAANHRKAAEDHEASAVQAAATARSFVQQETTQPQPEQPPQEQPQPEQPPQEQPQPEEPA